MDKRLLTFLAVWAATYFILQPLSQCLELVAGAAMALLSAVVADLLLKSYQIFLYERQTIQNTSSKAVLITGCDTGFGNSLAKQLSMLGFRVYAGCLQTDSTGAQELSKVPNTLVVQLNVTKQEDVDNAVLTVQNDLSQKGYSLWSIVNNAGIASYGEVELLSLEHFDRVFSVNTFGPLRVTKAFLPMLRRAGQARVVNVVSQSGRFTKYGFAAYSMSKHAAVSLSDALRVELKKWGVTVHTIEPGLYRTPITNTDTLTGNLDKMWDEVPESIKTDYGYDYLADLKRSVVEHMEEGRPAKQIYEVIDDMVDAVAGTKPQIRYSPSLKTKAITRLMRFLPFYILDNLSLKGSPSVTPAALLNSK